MTVITVRLSRGVVCWRVMEALTTCWVLHRPVSSSTVTRQRSSATSGEQFDVDISTGTGCLCYVGLKLHLIH